MSGVSKRFVLACSSAGPRRWPQWREPAREAEALGYSTLLIADHFGRSWRPCPALVAAADATATARRHLRARQRFSASGAVAKEAATVDLLTDGRFELGIGAGWNAADYTKTGIPFDPPDTDQSLEEALHIMKTFFGGGDAGTCGGTMTFQAPLSGGWPARAHYRCSGRGRRS